MNVPLINWIEVPHWGAGITGLFLCVATLYDLRSRQIPNGLIFSGLGFVLVLWWVSPSAIREYLVAAVGLMVLGLFVRWLGHVMANQPGMGMGDVKLLVIIGGLMGYEGYWLVYYAVLLAGLVGGIGLLTGKMERTYRLPFAPFCLGGWFLARLVLPFEVIWHLLFEN